MSTNEAAVAIRMQDLSPEYAEILVIGNVLQKSGYFRDVRDQAQAVTKILFGRELGFSPIIAMSGIHIIEGKPALSSNLMATLIKRSGKYDYRVTLWTDDSCSLMFREKVDGKWEEVGQSIFTMDEAKRAGVVRSGGSWSKFPKAMLFARAISQGLRTYCPDVSAAPIYNPEEMGAEVNEDGDVTKLPKPAMPVERTTADIPVEPLKKDIGSRATEAPNADESKGSPTPQAPNRDGRPVASNANPAGSGPGEAADRGDATLRSAAPAEIQMKRDDRGRPSIDVPSKTKRTKKENEPAELSAAQRFHRRFREELSVKYQTFADQILTDWLNVNYPEYKGHVANIPETELTVRWQEAGKYARSYSVVYQ